VQRNPKPCNEVSVDYVDISWWNTNVSGAMCIMQYLLNKTSFSSSAGDDVSKQQPLLYTDRYKHRLYHCDFGNCFIVRHPHRAFTWRLGILNCDETDKDRARCLLFPQSIPCSTACDGDNCYPVLIALLPSASGTKAVLDTF